ncbi:hypothetical protein C2I18_18350 [Paenibacillus sp. PK3_47]|uniref:hypothetical protein n=1 Tax=Paenibacillus sp. PK3_47 TaxID=2072642 RepID=UPI00201DE3DC|nr:hypothetical protein [Paenibacillus sp. PK3_47]UQZ35311.1 hypothetical protein C2I18_18350 [Paenibacillus sp. PK3_47]
MNFLPPAKSTRWLYWMAAYGFILWLLLIMHRIFLLDENFDTLIALRFAILAFAVSGILHLLGWLGARLIWWFTTLGIMVGLALLYSSAYKDMSGWEDLAGFLSFAMMLLGGFALGLVVEGVLLLVLHLRKN